MPIQISPVIASNPSTMKNAIEKIAREAQSLQAVSGQEDKVYVNTAPTVANSKEGAGILYFDGVNYRI